MRCVRKIHVPPAPTGSQGVWERDDVVQEAYLVFVEIIGNWSPEIPFGRYLLANFPWRLRDAVYRGVGKRQVPPRMLGIRADADIELVDHTSVASEEQAVINTLVNSLEFPLDEVFRLHVLNRLTIREVAEHLGVSSRSAARYWQTARLRLRPDMSG
jgi:RNA polymerase sigma factor (sigma-70 family)